MVVKMMSNSHNPLADYGKPLKTFKLVPDSEFAYPKCNGNFIIKYL